MGKGGAAVVAKPAVERSTLAATIPEPCKEITKRSLRECIPAHLFVRSYTKSFGHLAWDLVQVYALWLVTLELLQLLPAACAPAVWLSYWRATRDSQFCKQKH